MMEIIKRFLKDESGLGTVEIVVILAVLITIAILFRNQLIGFITDLMDRIFGTDPVGTIPDAV